MLAGFGVVVSSGITVVVRRLYFSLLRSLFFSPLAQVFFPRSIETEIAAHDAGARSRGLFGSRHHLTLISQEQELCGTYVYDLEDPPVDDNAVSPSSMYYKPAAIPLSESPPGEDIYAPAHSPQHFPTPPPPAQAQPLPTEPVRLTPNRRQSSVEGVSLPAMKYQQQQQVQPSNLADRFNNPATSVSRLKPKRGFRSPIGVWSPPAAHFRLSLPSPPQFFRSDD